MTGKLIATLRALAADPLTDASAVRAVMYESANVLERTADAVNDLYHYGEQTLTDEDHLALGSFLARCLNVEEQADGA